MGLLPFLRGLHMAAVLSALGVGGFLAWALPAAEGSAIRPMLLRLWRGSAWLAIGLGIAWFAAEAADMAGATSPVSLAAALPTVASRTRFGQVMALRLALLLAAALLAARSRFRLYAALLAVALAAGLQGGIGHAGARGDAMLLAAEWLHLIAAGLWLGGLLPLWLAVGRLPAATAAALCERFSPLGLGCVLVLAGTGLIQGLTLIGPPAALTETLYGRMVLLKTALFLLALALAGMNRLWLTDRLRETTGGARGRLRLSVLAETAVGLLIVLAAGFLASASPGMPPRPAGANASALPPPAWAAARPAPRIVAAPPLSATL